MTELCNFFEHGSLESFRILKYILPKTFWTTLMLEKLELLCHCLFHLTKLYHAIVRKIKYVIGFKRVDFFILYFWVKELLKPDNLFIQSIPDYCKKSQLCQCRQHCLIWNQETERNFGRAWVELMKLNLGRNGLNSFSDKSSPSGELKLDLILWLNM